MFSYFKMKKNEWKVKSAIYGAIAAYLDNQDGVLNFFKEMYESMKDVNSDEIKEMLVSKVVEAVSNGNNDIDL